MGFLITSCSELKPDKIGVVTYFDVDSLTNHQVEILSSKNFTLNKTVMIDGKSESKSITPDSADWERELRFLRQLNINKPRLIGAYDSLVKSSSVRYIPKFDSEIPIRYLEVKKENGIVTTLSGKLVEKNDIYETSLEATLQFDESSLSTYSVNGYQKIVLKDSVFYNIRGKINQ